MALTQHVDQVDTEVLMAGVDLLSLIPPRPAWMADAACRETPGVIFFPTAGESTEDAKAVCARCLVADECLAYARENGEQAGVWGARRSHHPAGPASLAALGRRRRPPGLLALTDRPKWTSLPPRPPAGAATSPTPERPEPQAEAQAAGQPGTCQERPVEPSRQPHANHTSAHVCERPPQSTQAPDQR